MDESDGTCCAVADWIAPTNAASDSAAACPVRERQVSAFRGGRDITLQLACVEAIGRDGREKIRRFQPDTTLPTGPTQANPGINLLLIHAQRMLALLSGRTAPPFDIRASGGVIDHNLWSPGICHRLPTSQGLRP